jgi:hypothetical protein
MADISMCSGLGCPKKDNCHRHTATACEYRQSWFAESNVSNEDGTCDHFWDNEGYENERPKHFTEE